MTARQQLDDGDYTGLIEHYSKEPPSEDTSHILSLLYRLTDQYAQEAELVTKCLTEQSDWPYMRERQSWHALEDFGKTVPRAPVIGTRDPSRVPTPEDLEKLIFVTGGDSRYFTWIIETVESIRAGGFYSEIPIGILDCGLLESERQYLSERFDNIVIQDPGFDFADPLQLQKSWLCGITEQNLSAFKAITSRAYLDRHFPGYEYYFWLDSDAWVQVESSLDQYIWLAKKQKIGISETNYELYCSNTMFFNERFMTAEMLDTLRDNKMVTCAGVICLTPAFLADWRVDVEKLYREKAIVNNSPSLWYTLHRTIENPEFLPHSFQFFFKREGLPLLDEDGILYAAEADQPCGIIHLNGFYEVRERYRYFPTRKRTAEFDLEEHKSQSWAAIRASLADVDTDPMTLDVFPDQTSFSFRYRVWPWRDKAQIARELRHKIG